MSIASANCTSWWSALAAIKTGGVEDHDILLLRETHLQPCKVAHTEALAKQLGCIMHSQSPSTVGSKSPRGSGGVAILRRPRLAARLPGPVDGVPEHRAAAIAVRAKATGECRFATLYGDVNFT